MKYLARLSALFLILAAACTPESSVNKNNGGDNGGDNGGGDVPIPPQPTEEVLATIYSEDFDGSPSYTGFMTNADWHNPKGEGALEVEYSSWNASIYSSYGSSGAYTGASGKCFANIYQSSNGNFGHLEISGIALGAYSNFRLSFGAIQGSDVLRLELSSDGAEWTSIPYSTGKDYNNWTRVETGFSIGEGVTSLQIKFTLLGGKESYTYGAKLDDLLLEAVEEPYETVLKGPKKLVSQYAELPVIDRSNQDYYYNTLYTTTVSSKKRVRNFSFCYDVRRHNPVWVAFPMHSIYAEGSGRSKDANGNDPWMQYPDLGFSQQSIIWDIKEDGKHMFWSNKAEQTGSMVWTKGHLCMSSSRSGAGEEINLQTFYPVNIAPQPNQYTSNFSTIWSKTEDMHWQRGSQICSDTLYIVTGCHYGDETWFEYDACDWGEQCEYSKPCIIPTNQYKILLRTVSGNSGKPVHACSASELKAIGFWMDIYLPENASPNLADYAVSVSEIERRTGQSFFPDIPAEVKSQCRPSDWGL